MSRNSQQAIIEDMEQKWMGPIILCFVVLDPVLKFIFSIFSVNSGPINLKMVISKSQDRYFPDITYHSNIILIQTAQCGDRAVLFFLISREGHSHM
jgi:hypothetical protein